MSVNDWSTAFLLTQGIEVPLYLWWARSLPMARRAIHAVGASTITHPVIWFCLPWETSPYVPLLLAAESFAVVVEALWGRLWKVPRAWSASLFANAASLAFGSVIRWALDRAAA